MDVSKGREFANRLQRRDQVMQQLHDLNEREKTFMSCAIHDGLLQDIIGADMLLQGVEEMPPEQRAGRIRLARKTIRQAIDHGRRLISELRPMILDEQGLVSAIEFYAAELENRSSLSVEVRSDLDANITCSIWGCNVFRIIQEALNNVEAHSGVSTAKVEVTQQDGVLRATIRDEGAGFDSTSSETGGHGNDPNESFGMRCMRERASIFGGSTRIESSKGNGTTVIVEVPLPQSGVSTSH